MTTWSKKNVEWVENDTTHISVVFTWNLEKTHKRAAKLVKDGKQVKIGGPASLLHPEYFSDLNVEVNTNGVSALPHHNPDATFTSRGCDRGCPFCPVHRIEGSLRELDDYEIKPIVCDNNFAACSRKHIDRVIDDLKGISGVDFNQGLDARFMTPYLADRLTELDMKVVRLAWDDTRYESQFMRAYEILKRAGFKPYKIRVFVLIGFNDTPGDALYRLKTVRGLGSFPNPMRYQPLDTTKRNSYVAPGWTDHELKRYMRYWARLNWLSNVPFEEYDHHYYKKNKEV